jgi:hypothetical protein
LGVWRRFIFSTDVFAFGIVAHSGLLFSVNLAIFNGGRSGAIGVFFNNRIPYFNLAVLFDAVKSLKRCHLFFLFLKL